MYLEQGPFLFPREIPLFFFGLAVLIGAIGVSGGYLYGRWKGVSMEYIFQQHLLSLLLASLLTATAITAKLAHKAHSYEVSLAGLAIFVSISITNKIWRRSN